MTTRPETSYEKNVIQFKTLWSLAVHKGIEEWLDRLIADAQEMRRDFFKGDGVEWRVDPKLFHLERAVSHIRSGYIELGNIESGDHYLSVARDWARQQAEIVAARKRARDNVAPTKKATVKKDGAPKKLVKTR